MQRSTSHTYNTLLILCFRFEFRHAGESGTSVFYFLFFPFTPGWGVEVLKHCREPRKNLLDPQSWLARDCWYALSDAWKSVPHRTYHRFPHSEWSRPYRADACVSDLFDLAHDAVWEPYNLHHLGRHVSCIGSVPYVSQPLKAVGEDLDCLNGDLPDAF